MKIKNRLIFSHLITGIAPIFLSFVLLLIAFCQNTRGNADLYMHKAIDEIQSRWLSDFRNVSNVMTRYAAGYDPQTSPQQFVSSASNLFLSLYYQNSYELDFYFPSAGLFTNARITLPYSATNLDGWISDFDSNAASVKTICSIAANSLVLRFVYPVTSVSNRRTVGLAILTILADEIYFKNYRSLPADMSIFAQFGDHTAYYSPEADKNFKMIETLGQLQIPERQIEWIGQESSPGFYIYKERFGAILQLDKLYIGVVMQTTRAYESIFALQWIWLVVFIFSALVALGIAFYFSRKITTPLQSLQSMLENFNNRKEKVLSPEVVDDEISELQMMLSEITSRTLEYSQNVDSYNESLSKQVEEKTRDLMNKLRGLTLISEFSSFSMRQESLNEADFIQNLIVYLKDLLKLNYVSIYAVRGRTVERINSAATKQYFSDPKIGARIQSLESRSVGRLMRTGENVVKVYRNAAALCYPIYFIDQIEFCLFYICDSRQKRFIYEAMGAVNNMISMKIYSLRIYSEKIQSEKMASVGQFASTIIHDIKNPMTIIKSIVEVLGDEDYSEAEKSKYLTILQKEIDRLIGMLNDLLDFARGTITLNMQEIKLDEFIREIADFYKKTMEDKKIAFTVDVHSNYTLKLDRDRMWRCIGNIIANAVDVLGEGGKIAVSAEKKIFDVIIKIEDNGPGIPQAIISKMFEPFVTHGKKNGTGLGLSIVKKIVESHGGNITFKTSPDKGTIFYISLPI